MNENNQDTTEQPATVKNEYIGQEVQIGGGFGGMKPLAQHGSVTISDGTLSLFDSKGALIDSAPLQQVTVKKLWYTMGGTAMVTMGDTKYSVAIGHGQFLGAPMASLGAATAGTGDFCKVFEQLKTSL